jgi:hypothetical protein
MKRAITGLAIAWAITTGPPAFANFGVGAVDSATRQVGAAFGSCDAPMPALGVYGPAPGHGLVLAGGLPNAMARDQAVMQLLNGSSASDVLAAITRPDLDPQLQIRQWNVIDLVGHSASYRGLNVDVTPFTENLEARMGSITYAVQVTHASGPAMIGRAHAAFELYGCDLADRLMLALEAASQDGDGDLKCTMGLGTDAGAGPSVPANAAFLEVDRGGEPAGAYLRLSVIAARTASALPLLRQRYDAWRQQNPCPNGSSPGMLPAGGVSIDAPVIVPPAPPPGCAMGGAAVSVALPAGLVLMLLFMVGRHGRSRSGRDG